MTWIWLILAGAVVGLLGKYFAPGDKDDVPLLLTVGLGIAGVIGGRFLAGLIGVRETSGPDWIKWAIQIGLATVLVMGASIALARRKKAA
jgi:uncharacterized membrane protein YeaQ/YmgE (transglycosylase-associated protein family)